VKRTQDDDMRVIDDLKARADLVDIARNYTQLHSAGRGRWKGLCPLHRETNPSFFVFSDSQRWHCFGCDKGGDVLDLVQAVEGWDFPTALRELAQQVGFDLPVYDAQVQTRWQEKRNIQHVFSYAVHYFQASLQQPDSPGMAYALCRGWSQETIRDAQLGYYDGNQSTLQEALQKAGIDIPTPAAQMVLRTPGPSLIYPFMSGATITYYTARLIDPPVGKAKAWNPPSDVAGSKPLYFNHIYRADAPAVILVEGQGDAVTCAQWGLAAIATLGTHHPEDDLARKLNRHQHIYIGVEADATGERHASALAEDLHPMVSLIHWPQDDANAWLQAGASTEDVQLLLKNAPTWLDVLVERLHNRKPSDAEVKHLFATIARLDPFQLARQKDRIRDKLNLSIRTFNKLLNLSQEPQSGSARKSEDYCTSDGVICRKVMDANGAFHLSPLCNFDARIIREVLVDDGWEKNRFFHITGSLPDGTVLPEVRIPASRFTSLDWVLEAWGMGATLLVGPYKSEHLRCAIQQLSAGAEQQQEVGHLGWRDIDGHPCFLSGNGALGDAPCTVSVDSDLLSYELPIQPVTDAGASAQASLDFWEVGDLCAVVPLWAFMYLVPLSSHLHPSFTLWIYGTTGTMKSTLTALAMSHFGRFSYDKPATSWNSTAYSLQRLAFLAKDTPLWVDDFALPTTVYSKRILQDKADMLLREWGNRSIRSAGMRTGKLRAGNVPRGLVVTTAETLPANVSIRARLFTVEMHPGMVIGGFGSRLTRAQKDQAAQYPACMAGYIRWLAGQWDELETTLQGLFSDFQEKAREHLTHHPRTVSNTAMLGTGLEMGLRYIQFTGILDDEEAAGYKQAGWDILLALAEHQDREVNREFDSIELFFKALDSLLTQGSGHLRLLRQPDAESMVRPQLRTPGSLLLGWYDDDNWYLLPQIAYQAVYQFYRASGILFPDTETGIRTKLSERGMIAKSNKDRLTYQLTLKTERKRVLVVPAHGQVVISDDFADDQ
jgi:DNA primase